MVCDRHVWYSSSCCYRRVVRHVRSVYYEPVDEGYSYYRRPYYHSYYNGDYGRPYYRYGYYGHPYHHHYDGDYVYRPYNHYNLGYDLVGYASYDGCGRVPLADGRGGWVWSRRAGCF